MRYSTLVLNIVQLQLRAAWKNGEKLKVSRIRNRHELGPLTLTEIVGVVRETVSALKSSLSVLFLVIVLIRYDTIHSLLL